MLKVLRAAELLLAGVLVLAPVSAQAGVGDDVTSFFDRVATRVKIGVVALPKQLGISDLIRSKPVVPVAEVALTPVVASPDAVVPSESISLKAELAHFQLPTVSVSQFALPEPSVETTAHRFFCAEYARIRSGFPVFGDAKYWWDRAKNLYARVTEPVAESVMVFASSQRLKRGHVAVVTDIVSSREIRVDQANWQNHGEIDHSTPVLDVSADNDWSKVRVWDVRSRQFGAHVYPISGFIVKPPVRQAMRD